jgi:hypothetical protein
MKLRYKPGKLLYRIRYNLYIPDNAFHLNLRFYNKKKDKIELSMSGGVGLLPIKIYRRFDIIYNLFNLIMHDLYDTRLFKFMVIKALQIQKIYKKNARNPDYNRNFRFKKYKESNVKICVIKDYETQKYGVNILIRHNIIDMTALGSMIKAFTKHYEAINCGTEYYKQHTPFLIITKRNLFPGFLNSKLPVLKRFCGQGTYYTMYEYNLTVIMEK